jgi:hypothetical protein
MEDIKITTIEDEDSKKEKPHFVLDIHDSKIGLTSIIINEEKKETPNITE